MSSRPHILLVHDEPLVLESLREIVEKEGRHEIAVAENGKKALESATREVLSLPINQSKGVMTSHTTHCGLSGFQDGLKPRRQDRIVKQ
jgi:CheY-like chemotaxis protein